MLCALNDVYPTYYVEPQFIVIVSTIITLKLGQYYLLITSTNQHLVLCQIV